MGGLTIMRGRVTRLEPDGRAHVEIADLGSGYSHGPLDVATPSVIVVGARVLVGMISDQREDLVVVGVVGAEAISGGGGAGADPVTFEFPDPVLSWSLPHGFGALPASLVLVDPDEHQLDGEVSYPDLDTVLVEWDTPTAGVAIVHPSSGAGPRGLVGPPGASAYQLAVAGGFVGSQAAWVASLEGDPGDPGPRGMSAYQVAVAQGFVGSEALWLQSIEGTDGASAYEVAVAQGFVGSEAAWLASIKGTDGIDGTDGLPGIVTVKHGDDPAVARPAAAIVHWVGLAVPANAVPTDFLTRRNLP